MELEKFELAKEDEQLLVTWSSLNKFVVDNWTKLYIAACKLGWNIPEDYYAPERIMDSSRGNRLHSTKLIKWVSGKKTRENEFVINNEVIQSVVNTLNDLIRAYNTPAEIYPIEVLFK